MTEPEIRYCTTSDGVNIAYAIVGAGPPIVRVSQFPSHISREHTIPLWSFVERLSGQRSVIVYDSRGAGLSQRDALDFSLEARLRDLEAVVDAVQLDRFDLIANFHAGMGAISYAALHAERVSRMALLNPCARGEDLYRMSDAIRVYDALGTVTQEQWEFVTDTMASNMGRLPDPDVSGRVAEFIRASITPEALLAFRDENRRTDVTDILGQVAVPTLVTHRAGSEIPQVLCQRVAAGIPGARFFVESVDIAEPAWLSISDRVEVEVARFFGLDAMEPAIPSGPASVSARGGLQTVLFTDIVGHTEMMQRLGDDKGRDVLREHERITRETLKEYSGAEVKTMGDGFMASFGSVTKAMDCAIALQRAFARSDPSPSPSPTGGGEHLAIRIGLNAGEPIEEDGDLFGSTVILASRIAAQAGAGEILIPEPLRHLLSGKSYVYADRGETALKGFEDAARLYEVRWQV